MSEVKLFCTDCWHQVREGDTFCPSCGNDLSVFNDLTYEEKLMKALIHFEPQTAVRAAEVLAIRNSKAGADAIADAFVNRSDLDPIMARVFLASIAAILGKDETDVAIELRRRGDFHSETAFKVVQSVLND